MITKLSKVLMCAALFCLSENSARALDSASVAVGAGAVVAAPLVIAATPAIVAGTVAVAVPVAIGTAAITLNPISLANKYLDDDCMKDGQTGVVYGCNTTKTKIPFTDIGVFNKCPDNPVKDGVKIFSSFPKVMQCSAGATADRWIEVSQSFCPGFPAVSSVPANAKAAYAKSATKDACWGWKCNDTYGFNDKFECVKMCTHNGVQYTVGTKLACEGDGIDFATSTCGTDGTFGNCIIERCKSTHSLVGGKCVRKSAPKPPVVPTPTPTPGPEPAPLPAAFNCDQKTLDWLNQVKLDYSSEAEIVAKADAILTYCLTDSSRNQSSLNVQVAELNALIDALKIKNQKEKAKKDSLVKIEEMSKSITTGNGLDKSHWKNADGGFNTSRLVSDSVAGVVLGTAGGLITSNIIKKNQIKGGFEDISCTIAGQNVADFGDEFQVGIR
ncbi:MAG: hypothetical protein LBJ18_02525 [Rickettsiales bacterium]|jgi:hypothetical protein|nr:hypothetical protein [Rickettsiales bacterium]